MPKVKKVNWRGDPKLNLSTEDRLREEAVFLSKMNHHLATAAAQKKPTLSQLFWGMFGSSLYNYNRNELRALAQDKGLHIANLSAYIYGILQGLAMGGYFLSLCGLEEVSEGEVDFEGGAGIPALIVAATITALLVVAYRNMHLVRQPAEDAAIEQYYIHYQGMNYYFLMTVQLLLGINLSIEDREHKGAEWGARIFAVLGSLLFAGITSYGNFLMFADLGDAFTQQESDGELEPWAYALIGYMSLRLFACEYELLFNPLYDIFTGDVSLTSSWKNGHVKGAWETTKYAACILAPLIAMICMSLVCTEMLANGMKNITIDGEGMGETAAQYLSFSILLTLALAQLPFYLEKANKLFKPDDGKNAKGSDTTTPIDYVRNNAYISRAINALFNSPSSFLGIIAAVMMFDDGMDAENPGLMALGVFCAAAGCLSSWIANRDVPEASGASKRLYLNSSGDRLSYTGVNIELQTLYTNQKTSWAPVL